MVLAPRSSLPSDGNELGSRAGRRTAGVTAPRLGRRRRMCNATRRAVCLGDPRHATCTPTASGAAECAAQMEIMSMYPKRLALLALSTALALPGLAIAAPGNGNAFGRKPVTTTTTTTTTSTSSTTSTTRTTTTTTTSTSTCSSTTSSTAFSSTSTTTTTYPT